MAQQQGPETVETGTVATVTESWRVVIRATYHGPTNTRGTRIRVRRWDGSGGHITVAWNYALNSGENYAAAVETYLARVGWDGRWTVAQCDGGAVAVYVGKVGA